MKLSDIFQTQNFSFDTLLAIKNKRDRLVFDKKPKLIIIISICTASTLAPALFVPLATLEIVFRSGIKLVLLALRPLKKESINKFYDKHFSNIALGGLPIFLLGPKLMFYSWKIHTCIDPIRRPSAKTIKSDESISNEKSLPPQVGKQMTILQREMKDISPTNRKLAADIIETVFDFYKKQEISPDEYQVLFDIAKGSFDLQKALGSEIIGLGEKILRKSASMWDLFKLPGILWSISQNDYVSIIPTAITILKNKTPEALVKELSIDEKAKAPLVKILTGIHKLSDDQIKRIQTVAIDILPLIRS